MASLEQEKAKTLALLKKGYSGKSYEDLSQGYRRKLPTTEPLVAPAPVEEWPKTTHIQDFLNLPLVRGTFNVASAPIGAIKNTIVGAFDPTATGTNTAEQFAAGASDFYKQHPLASVGTLGLGNVIGGLSNVGQQAKTGEDVVKASYALGLRSRGVDAQTASMLAENMAKEHPNLVGAAGLTFDLTADPLNAVTGGESAVAKSLARAAQDEALRIAKEAGIKTTRKVAAQDVPNQVYQQTIDRYKNNEALGQLPVLQKGTQQAEDRIAKLAEINKAKVASQIEAKAKEAARRTQNSILSLNIPFTNKVKDIGNKANIPVVGNYLTKTPDLLGTQNAYLVRKMFENIEPTVKNVYTKDATGVVQSTKEIVATPEQRMMNFLKQRYKINSLDEMTVDMFRDLQEAFKGVSPSKLPLIKTSYKPSMQPVKETITTETPFNLEQVIASASPEVKQIVQDLAKKGSTAEDIIRDLPTILREQAKLRIAPTPKQVIPSAVPEQVAQDLAPKVQAELTHDQKVKGFISEINKYINTPEGKINISPKASGILVNLAKNKDPRGLETALKEFELLKQGKTSAEVKPLEQKVAEDIAPKQVPKEKTKYNKPSKTNTKTPFEDNKNFSSSRNVPKDYHSITAEWKDMLGVDSKIHLMTTEDAMKSKFEGVFQKIQLTAKKLKNGEAVLITSRSFPNQHVLVYKPSGSKALDLELISHELGHATMRKHYENASANVKKAIDEEYDKWKQGVVTDGTLQNLVDSMRAYKNARMNRIRTGKLISELPKDRQEYWLSKDEWFADQVSRWATTTEKPLTVVEKFFFRLAQVMKRFFQANKQYLPNQTMKDWLDNLAKSAGADVNIESKTGSQLGAKSNEQINDLVNPREFMDYKDVTKRIPEIQEAAKKLKNNEITKQEFEDVVNKFKPVTPYKTIPKPASVEDLNRALKGNQIGDIGTPSRTLPEGERVGLRLDIPAYTNHGVWVVTVHEPAVSRGAGKKIGYESVAQIKDVKFEIKQQPALNIAAGDKKGTIATMEGAWKKTTPEEAVAKAKEAMNSKEWTQVGMDPERHSYFYDRATMQPISNADEVIQIGGLVFAKNPKYASKLDFLFAKQEKLPKAELPSPEQRAKEIDVLKQTIPDQKQAEAIHKLDSGAIKELRSIAKKIETSRPVKVTTKKQLVKDVNGKLVLQDVGGTTKVLRKQESAIIDPFQILKKAPDFHQAANGKSKLSRAMRLNWFSSQLINSGNDFIDSYTGMIRDARTQVEGEARYLQRDLQKIKDMAQNMTDEDMLHVQYVVENRFPKNFTEEQKKAILDNENVKKAAETITRLMAYVGKEDLASGMIKKLRKDYFPHVLDISDKQWEVFKRKYASDPDLKGLIGVSQKGAHQKERKGFPTLAQVDDAIYIKQQKLEGMEEGSEQYLKTKEQLDALQGLFKRDTLDAVNSHIKRSIRARVMSDLYKQMKHDGLLYDSKPIHNADQFVQVTNDEMANALGIKLHSWIHSDVLNGLRKSEKVFSSEGMNKFMKTFEEVMRIWRLATYQLLPKHHVNNLIGNLFNSGMTGITSKSYKNAIELLQKHKNNPDKLTVAEQDLLMNAYKDGIIGQGYGAEFRPFEKDHKSFLAKAANWMQSNAYGKSIMNMGEAVDDWSRLALYMHGLSTFGGNRKTAAELVRKYLFNYHEMTQSDRYIRGFVPFWLWMKNNIPLQIEQLIKNPRYILTAEKIRQMTFDDKEEMMGQPEYIRDGYFNLFGTKYKLPLPMYDLNMFNGVLGTAKSAMGTLNPFLQMVPELATNESLLTGAPIQKEMERRRNKQEGYDLPTLAGYAAGKVGGFPAWAVKDIAKNKDNLTALEEAWRIAQSYGFGSPAIQK